MSQFGDLNKRLEEWLTRGVTIELKELPPPAESNLIVATENELLPLHFQAEVGAYINSIRSSLDVLAMVLVKRHNLQIRESRVFFPIVKSKEEFERTGSDAQKFLEGLPKLERQLMEHLKPYQGGNDALWALHHLDIVRKHRRLLNARLRPIHMSIQGTLAEGDFTPLGGEGSIQVGAETVLGMIKKGVPPLAVHTRFYVGIDEEGFAARKPATAVLVQLINAATYAIKLFDDS
ncbi:hypothetical protein [Bradyrhizobium sp. UNPF46]|uniref:hypothetical protein n=1 Tax=Bradyrhizobium sp. UNPF46 TaxID=1141168 RepID=UPI0011510B0C|nr:hypothetical protein [Bradyrhizobium sp. UNPF46]